MNKKVQTVIIIIAILLIASSDLLCQAFGGVSVAYKAFDFNGGVLFNKTEFRSFYSVPYLKTETPTIASLTIGQKFDITKWDEDNYSIMPYAGYSYLKWQDFTDYNAGKPNINKMEDYKPIAGLQIGKDAHAGNVFIYYHWCKVSYAGIGLKVYFSKL